MSTEALITVVQGQPNRDLIGSLNIDSPLLQLQLREFKKVRAKMRRATVVAFFETEETPTITQVRTTVFIRYKYLISNVDCWKMAVIWTVNSSCC